MVISASLIIDLSEWDPQAVKEAINFLKPENMIIFLESQRFAERRKHPVTGKDEKPICTKEEKWYGSGLRSNRATEY